MKRYPRASIVVNSFNRRQFALELLSKLAKQDYPRKKTEFIFVDGGSTDGTAEAVKRRYAWMKVIRTNENIGHSASLNLGCSAARGEIIIVFDSDALPVGRDYLRRMAEKFADKNVSFVATKIINYYTKKIMWDNAMHSRLPSKNGAFDCSIFNGASYGVRRSVWEKAGGYDEEMFLTLEEQYYAMKLRDAGYSLSYFPDIAVFHKMPADARFRSGRNRRAIKNTILWCCKYLPWKYVFLTLFGVGALFLQIAKGAATVESFQGALEGIANIPRYLAARREVLKEATVKYFFAAKKEHTNEF